MHTLFKPLMNVRPTIVKTIIIIVTSLLVLIGLLMGVLAIIGFNFRAPFYHGQTREYWIAVVPESWNIVPSGKDGMTGQTYEAKDTTIEALIYKQYTPNWVTALPDEYGGQPGPMLRANVGDTIKIHFLNLDSYYKRPHSMHPHGVHYTPENDGSFVYTDQQPGSAIPVGGNYTYTWTAGSDSVGDWVYHDHSIDTVNNTTLGMYGLIEITKPGTPKPEKQMVSFFDEMTTETTGLPMEFDTMNGRSFVGNTPTYKAKVGDHIQWIVAALGSDFHDFHIHGQRWLYDGRDQDVLEIGPAEAKSISFVENAPGLWLVHCHIDEHMMQGMSAELQVATKSGALPVIPTPLSDIPAPTPTVMHMDEDED